MAWDVQLTNMNVLPKGTSVNVRKLPGTTAAILATVKAGSLAGKTTGGLVKQTDGDWYQILLNDNKTTGYVRNDVVSLQKNTTVTVSESEAKTMIDQMIANDVDLSKNLIRIKLLIDNLKKKGIDVSQYEKTYQTLETSITQRQNKIKNSTLLLIKNSLPKNASDAGLKYAKGMEILAKSSPIPIMGIGAIPAVVIAAIIGAGLATAAYFAFKPDYTKGAQDLKVSKDLELALSKVDPATAKKIKDDLGKQIDDAYNKGKTDQYFESIFKVGKYVLIFGAGYFIIKSLVGGFNNAKTKIKQAKQK